MSVYILGINAYHGDAAAAIVKDGKIIAAVEEERFNRVKHCAGFPTESIRYCLQTAGIGIEDVEHIGISRDPSAHLHKKIMFAASRAVKQSGQWAVGSGQTAESGRQRADSRRQESIATIDGGNSPDGSGIDDNNNGGNGRGKGIFRQVKDRLANAAKVRDLSDELAQALGSSKSNL